MEWLDRVFAARSFDEWCQVLAAFEGEWVPSLRPADLAGDPQVRANGYLQDIDLGVGNVLPVVPTPLQFDGRPGRAERAPELGEHTEVVLLEMGLSWDDWGRSRTGG